MYELNVYDIIRIVSYPARCSNDDFWCNSGLGCVKMSMVCDGQLQCVDGSDEFMCCKFKKIKYWMIYLL